jgi:hypothetical protein
MSERIILEWVERSEGVWDSLSAPLARNFRIKDVTALRLRPAFCVFVNGSSSLVDCPSLEAAKALAQHLQDTLDDVVSQPRRMRYWLFDDGGPDEPLDAPRPGPPTKEPPITPASQGTFCKFKIGDVLRYQAWAGRGQPTLTTEQPVDAIRVLMNYGIQYEFFQEDGVVRIVDEKDCELTDATPPPPRPTNHTASEEPQ